jgi:hypothetical protein
MGPRPQPLAPVEEPPEDPQAVFKALPIDAMTPQRVDGFISSRRQAGVGNRTINRDLSVLSHMYEWAVGRGYLETNPLVRVERLEEVEWVGERPDEDVIDLVFSKLDPRVLPAFIFIERPAAGAGGIALRRPRSILPGPRWFHSSENGAASGTADRSAWGDRSNAAHGELVFINDTLRRWTGDSIAEQWEKARGAGQLVAHSRSAPRLRHRWPARTLMHF